MAFLRKKHGPWIVGCECLACGTVFKPKLVCPHCGQMPEDPKGFKIVCVRDTWTQVPEWLNFICLSCLWWDKKLEKDTGK